MKKLLSLLLSLLTLISAFCVCASALDGVDISKGKSYTLITKASNGYPDDGKKLTDGIFGKTKNPEDPYYNTGSYVGFNIENVDSKGNFVIILDLGKNYKDITSFSAGYLNETDIGIYAPKSITFSTASERNGEYKAVGIMETAKTTKPASKETFVSALAADKAEGRYVKITVTPLGDFKDSEGHSQKATWTFIDEIKVISAGTETPSDPESDTPETPQTGDAGVLGYFLLALAAAAVLTILVIFRKRAPFEK